MSVRSFHSVYMAGTVAAAALGCYLVSLRVASERASLESVETSIVDTQRDIRMLQTEIGTRGRLGQLEQWNASALDLSAPNANQFVKDGFQLATLIKPEAKPVEAPVVLASAPVVEPRSPLEDSDPDVAAPAPQPELLHQASLKIIAPDRSSVRTAVLDVPSAPAKPTKAPVVPAPASKPVKTPASSTLAPSTVAKASKPVTAPAVAAKTKASSAPTAVAKTQAPKTQPAKPIRLAEADPLAPLPLKSEAKDSHGKK
jgi:hypothetical protein